MELFSKGSTRIMLSASLIWGTGLFFGVAGCRKGNAATKLSPETRGVATTAAPNTPGRIDVCKIVTSKEAAVILGPLPMQPPSVTDSAGFGIYLCIYIGPKLSGEGVQTVFSRLTVQVSSGREGPDLMQMDADKRHVTIKMSGVGDRAKRNAEGSFVWAKRGPLYCTAEIGNGLPPSLTANSAATQLGKLCNKIFSKGKQ